MKSSPCAKFTTSMMPKISVRPDATSAKIMPVTIPLTVWIRIRSSGISTSDPQVLLDHGVAGLQLGGRGLMPDCALLHEINALARRQSQRHVLLDQQDRHALAPELADDLADLRDHTRHQPLGGLVQQDD